MELGLGLGLGLWLGLVGDGMCLHCPVTLPLRKAARTLVRLVIRVPAAGRRQHTLGLGLGSGVR